jgi:hypothetical protein
VDQADRGLERKGRKGGGSKQRSSFPEAAKADLRIDFALNAFDITFAGRLSAGRN